MEKPLYAIIDVETSGGKPHQSRITEIAIYIYDGVNIIEEYSSLVNPLTPIDFYVVKLTGINDQMVKTAPVFADVADRVQEILKDKIFVAHNVEFDFGMIKKEFHRIGKSINNQRLCTVKLAKKYIPGFPSYSLGTICDSLNIPHDSRHRAGGDALATVKLFGLIHQKLSHDDLQIELNSGVDYSKLPDHISIDLVNKLPETIGVLYLKDASNQVIYVESCKNLYTGFLKIIKQIDDNNLKNKLVQSIAEIDFETYFNYLNAALDKYYFIKSNKPNFNKLTQVRNYTHEVYIDRDEMGYSFLNLRKIQDEDDDVVKVKTTSKRASEKLIESLISKNKLEGLMSQLNHFKANHSEDLVASYNLQFNQVFSNLHFKNPNFFIFIPSNEEDKMDVFAIRNQAYWEDVHCR